MSKRKSISKKLRFEVFKRDSFTCQYCGKMAPDVVLEVDHINPVASGGDNDILNLVTSCFDCNRGKGKRKLSEKEEVKKQQEQLKELSEKREQLKMMIEWRDELSNFKNELAYEFEERFCDLTNSGLTEYGREKVKKWIDEFGLIEIINCMEISVSQYFDSSDERTTKKTFDYIPRIASVRKKQEQDPMYGKRNYIKGILKNRLNYINDVQLAIRLKKIKGEEEYEDVKEIALTCESWTDFRETFDDLTGESNYGY